MKALSTLAFGAIALITANFATAAPAAASNVGVYAGSNGFAIQVSHRDYYGGYYRNPCRSYWYRRHHPYRCGYRHYNPGYYGYYNNYYHNRPYYRRHYRHRDYDRHHRRHRDRRW